GNLCTSGIASICFLAASGKATSAAGCNCSPSQRSTPTACKCVALEALTPQVSRSSSIMSWGFNSPACAAITPSSPADMTSAKRPNATAGQPRQDGFELSASLIDSTNPVNLPTLQIYQSRELYRAPPAVSRLILRSLRSKRLEGWLQASDSRPSFETRRRRRSSG